MTEGYLVFYFCGSTFLTFLITSIVLGFFSKDKISRLAGVFAIKPVIAYGFSFMTWWYFYYRWHPNQYIWYVIHFVIETCLLLAIVVWFKDLHKESNRLLRSLVGFDLFRWGSVLFLFSDFGLLSNADMAYFILFIFPVISAIFAFVFAITRRRKLQIIQESI